MFDTCATPYSAPILVANPVQVREPISIVVTIVYSTHEPSSQIQSKRERIGALQNPVR